MSKSNQKTIADLSINWTFTKNNYLPFQVMGIFEILNPRLSKLKIKKGDYRFQIYDREFSACCTGEKIIYFFENINYQTTKFIDVPKELDKFELISENTFRIHVK